MNKRYRQGSIGVTASGGYEEDYFGAENLGLSRFYELGGTAAYHFTKHITGNIFSSYRKNNYKDVTPDRDDKMVTAGLGFTYQLLQWMTLGLDYSYRDYDTTQIGEEYVENRGVIRVNIFPIQPYRFK